MLATTGAPERVRWEVIFVYKGEVHRKRFGDDLPSAMAYLAKALAKGPALKHVGLRSANLGFPPPAKLRPREVLVRVKGRKKPVPKFITPMRKLNVERGIWWCPLCMKLLPFTERRVNGGKRQHCCPLCNISHRDHHVAKWNPIVWERIEPRQRSSEA